MNQTKYIFAQKQPELYSLQVLRAIAATGIVFEHVNRISYLYFNRNLGFSPPIFGDWAVDLFFVISGFIIFYVHNDDFGKPKRVKEYLIKRFLRIYPLYWLITLSLIAFFFIFKNIGSGYETEIDVIAKSLFLFPQTHAPILFPGWTLVHEIRFYLIFALLILLKKRLRVVLISIFIFLTFLMYVIKPQGYSYLNPQNVATYLFSFFNIEFLLGCFGAYIIKLANPKTQKVCLITLTLLYLIYLRFSNVSILEERVWLLGIPFTIIMTIIAIYELKHHFKISKVLRFLALASYSIYLTHYLFISILIRLVISSGLSHSLYLPWIMLIILLLSIGGGCIIYFLVERPVLKFLKSKLLTKYELWQRK